VELPRTTERTPRLRVLDSAGSTNDVLAELNRESAEPALSTVVTLDQTSGRGRLGRVWTAPKDKTLAASVLVRPGPIAGRNAFPFGWIPLLAGAAMCASVDALVGGGRTGLKWPNDVQVDGLKVCGVLAELVPAGDAVIVGTGVNLTLTEAELPVPTATSLALAGVTERGDDLVDLVLSRYLATLGELIARMVAADGDEAASGIHRAVSEWCRTIGRDVRVSLPSGEDLFGVATGLDSTGRLLVRATRGSEITAVAAGDVTHLRYE
jgi:BirA family transcriptional regulator, biotin operon repressor / biotin---[acetyl-CoA-carboxylase] ligase